MTSVDGSFKFEEVYHFKSSIYSVKIANKNLIAVTKNILLRYSFADQYSFEEIKIPCENDLALNIFLDPTGNHALICMQSEQSFYLHKTSKKLRLIREFNGLLIESVGWNTKHCTEMSTGCILLGTTTGELIETKLTNSSDQYLKKIHKLDQSITGIVFDSYPDSNSSKYFLVFTTATNLYPHFFDLSYVTKGSSLFVTEFERINQFPVGSKCTTFPMQFGYSLLDLFYRDSEPFPNYLAWMNGAGVYYSKFHKHSNEAEGTLFNGSKLLPYHKNMKNAAPISVAATEFHVILQYGDVINFVCVINEETVYSFNIDKLIKEKGRGLCKDSTTGFIYLFTDTNLYRINCDDETKTLWRTFVNLKNYDLAYAHCNNSKEKNLVRVREAEDLYKEQRYIDAAVLYANTDSVFEETVSLFIDLENKEALKKYLLGLNIKPNSDIEKRRNTYDVISMWLLELFFEEIIGRNFQTGSDITNEDHDYKKYVECPNIIISLKRNKDLIYEKIKIYGDCQQSIIFAEIIQDREKIMENLIENGKYQEAMKMLSKEKSETLHYKYGAKIIGNLPNDVVELWMKMSAKLNPKKVLPIIRNIPDEIARKYVRHLVVSLNCDYDEMHNFYILILARLSGDSPDLIDYLKTQGTDIHNIKYDPTLALRICMEYKNIEGSVFLHCLLNKNKEAVELALKERNVELAKKVATSFYGSEEMKKNLWLQIAHFIIKEQKDVSGACLLVKSQHVLKLEDILPYFPDYVKIEQFSEAICDSLDYYESHKANLKADMKMSTDYADKNRQEINLLRQKPLIIPDNCVCGYCKELLTARMFCAFSCGHCFHLHCLEQVVEPLLSNEAKTHFYSLKEKLSQTTYDDIELKKEVQTLLTNDCCYCGTMSIDNIDVPLLNHNEFDTEMSLWR